MNINKSSQRERSRSTLSFYLSNLLWNELKECLESKKISPYVGGVTFALRDRTGEGRGAKVKGATKARLLEVLPKLANREKS